MRRLRLAAAALLALAPGWAPAAGAPVDDGFSPLLERRLLQQLADDCLRLHPQMRGEIARVREGWLARNAAALAQYDARWAALPTERRADAEKTIQQVASAWHARLEHEEATGNGELACTNQLVRMESAAPVPMPEPATADGPAPEPAPGSATGPAPAPAPISATAPAPEPAAPEPAAEPAVAPAATPAAEPESAPAPATEPTQG